MIPALYAAIARRRREWYAAHPEARWKIIGGRPPPSLLALAGPRVTLTGFVSDLRPHLAEAAVVVVPLRLGGGTRLKIVEAMAMGKAIVSTTLGAEGIEAGRLGKRQFAHPTPRRLPPGGRRLVGLVDDGDAIAVDRYGAVEEVTDGQRHTHGRRVSQNDSSPANRLVRSTSSAVTSPLGAPLVVPGVSSPDAESSSSPLLHALTTRSNAHSAAPTTDERDPARARTIVPLRRKPPGMPPRRSCKHTPRAPTSTPGARMRCRVRERDEK